MAKRTSAKQITEEANRVLILALCGTVLVLTVIVGILLAQPVKVVANFEQCKAEGGAILEVYPEVCRIGNVSFTNNSQSVVDDTYVGMTEKAALAKAESEKIPARVVERNGESLPVTMDFVFGRNNLYVKDGKVYKVEIEGRASDLPLDGNE